MSRRRAPRPSGSTKRLLDRLALRPGTLHGMLAGAYGYSRRGPWNDAPAPRRPAAGLEVIR